MKLPVLKQEGITLIETLAVVVISVIILISATTILTRSSSEHTKQTNNTEQLSEVRYVLKQITKDMRMSTKIEKNESNYIFKSKDSSIIATYSFNETARIIKRNSTDLARNIQVFNIDIDSSKILIKVKALNQKEVQTELLFRSGK